jgi:hypothetical protein
MKKEISLILTLFLLCSLALAEPTKPQAFNGYVLYSDGNPVQESLKLRAELNGFNKTVALQSGYFDIVVQSDDSKGTVYFFLEGLGQISEQPFQPFEVTEIDFTTTLVNPNGGGSSSSGSTSGGGGSSSGGGGGGGSGTPITFQCEEWGDCINGQQERICYEKLGRYPNKTETQNCVIAFTPLNSENPNPVQTTSQSSSKKTQSNSGITGAVIGTLKTPAGIGVSIAVVILILGVIVITTSRKK